MKSTEKTYFFGELHFGHLEEQYFDMRETFCSFYNKDNFTGEKYRTCLEYVHIVVGLF
jgi:hypothetical protein